MVSELSVYFIVGAVVYYFVGGWRDFRPSSVGIAMIYYFGHLLRLTGWPFVLSVRLGDKMLNESQLSWKIDYEGVELSVRESVARDIEDYRNFMISRMNEGGVAPETREWAFGAYNEVAKVVRFPKAWREHRAEMEK